MKFSSIIKGFLDANKAVFLEGEGATLKKLDIDSN